MNFGKDIDMVTYKQMGYTQKQVKNAQEYSKRNKIDMFEALQRLQQADRQMEEKKSTPPTHSYMKPLKNVKVQDYEVIYSKYVTHHSQLSREEIREVDNPVGLLNVSNCCYLNSLLQCYFLMGSFVRQILAAEPLSQLPHKEPVAVKRIKSQYGLLQSFKQMFSRLALSSKKYLNPLPVLKNLVDSVGQRIQYGDEKDLHEINMCIVERLSECLMFTKMYFFKSHQEVSQTKKIQRENIKKLFYGTRVEYMEGSDDKLETQFMGIILNPGYSNIMSALDNQFHFQVEVKEGKMAKKSIFMKQIPQYLFFNISRAQFQQGGKLLHKNSEKMSFDFTIYLDRYMDKYREKGIGINPLILDLTKQKNTLSRKLNYLEILTNKLDECRQYANHLEGWTEKLPLKQDLLSQKQSYRLQIEKIEENLQKIESREEKYVLMYIFVHRGDATSGHYWGYGRNGKDWYKYDINVFKIKEADILVDIEKSRAIPYALVYAQEKSLESFEYPYHLDFTENAQLLGIQDNKGYEEQIPHDIRKQIIMENKQLHEFVALKKNQDLLESLQKQYKIRYNLVKSECEQYKKKNYRVPLTNNFACYLNCEEEEELMKYNIFSTSLWSLSQTTPQQLAQDSALFQKIEKAFKKKIKGKMSLQYYLMGQEAPLYDAYRDHKMKYLLAKRYIKFINYLHSYMSKWPKIPLREEPILIADIEKFNSKDIDRIPAVLMILIEFMIKQLLIPGQIENYVLILNLQAFSMSMKDTVMKIISFTSNTYRGRLFASYLLSMPGILKFAWDSIASKFVSENTLRKIKISKNLVHEDMWIHIDEKIIERKYGGKMENIDSSFWPPSSTLMNFQSPTAKNLLIQESQYQQRYKNGMLNGRKVQKRLLAQQQTKSIAHVNKSIVRSEANINENIQEQLPSPQVEEKEKKHIHLQNILEFTNMPKNLIKEQKVPHIKRRPFQLFFQSDDYQNLMLKR